jgi:hypothetical protein
MLFLQNKEENTTSVYSTFEKKMSRKDSHGLAGKAFLGEKEERKDIESADHRFW